MSKKLILSTSYRVRYKTELCDRNGRVLRVLNRGRNVITDYGMNLVATKRLALCLTTLLLSSGTETLKRVVPGGNFLTPDFSDPSAVTIEANSNFFEVGDVGRTLKLNAPSVPEMRIASYLSPTEVVCSARGATWAPDDEPGAGTYTDAGVHYVDKATLGAYFASVTTFDTSATDYNTELSDYANSRFIEQRIFLSDVVSGSPWTINEIGWSDGNGGHNCFGKANLPSPDVVPIGKRYRVTLQVFNAYEPIDLDDIELDFGVDVGTYTCDIRQERIGYDANGYFSFTRPLLGSSSSNYRAGWGTGSPTLQPTYFEGNPSFATISRTRNSSAVNGITESAYVTDSHRRNRIITWADTLNIVNATFLEASYSPNASTPLLTIIPSTNFNKASGLLARLTFPLVWTRELVN